MLAVLERPPTENRIFVGLERFALLAHVLIEPFEQIAVLS